MNGARTTFMRRGYLLTALAAAVLLAASPGIASAQSIGFVGSSGMVSETASLESGALEGPHEITIRVSGLPPVGDPRRDATDLGTVALTTSHVVSIATVTRANPRADQETDIAAAAAYTALTNADFASSDEVTLVVAQSATGQKDANWYNEPIKLTLDAGSGVDVSPAVYTLTVQDADVAPMARFNVPSFTLTEGSQRAVALDIAAGRRGAAIPGAAIDAGETGTVTITVSNNHMVSISGCPPTPQSPGYNRIAVNLDLDSDDWGTPDAGVFGRTGRLQTVRDASPNLAGD